MYNWSVNENKLKKDSRQYTIWKLEQLINYGLGKDKLNKRKLEEYFLRLNIDPAKRKFLKLFLR